MSKTDARPQTLHQTTGSQPHPFCITPKQKLQFAVYISIHDVEIANNITRSLVSRLKRTLQVAPCLSNAALPSHVSFHSPRKRKGGGGELVPHVPQPSTLSRRLLFILLVLLLFLFLLLLLHMVGEAPPLSSTWTSRRVTAQRYRSHSGQPNSALRGRKATHDTNVTPTVPSSSSSSVFNSISIAISLFLKLSCLSLHTTYSFSFPQYNSVRFSGTSITNFVAWYSKQLRNTSARKISRKNRLFKQLQALACALPLMAPDAHVAAVRLPQWRHQHATCQQLSSTKGHTQKRRHKPG